MVVVYIYIYIHIRIYDAVRRRAGFILRYEFSRSDATTSMTEEDDDETNIVRRRLRLVSLVV